MKTILMTLSLLFSLQSLAQVSHDQKVALKGSLVVGSFISVGVMNNKLLDKEAKREILHIGLKADLYKEIHRKVLNGERIETLAGRMRKLEAPSKKEVLLIKANWLVRGAAILSVVNLAKGLFEDASNLRVYDDLGCTLVEMPN